MIFLLVETSTTNEVFAGVCWLLTGGGSSGVQTAKKESKKVAVAS
jgi:hypothetical protein